MGVAAQKVYDFIWNSFCDWYIELAKIRLNGDDEQAKKDVENVLCYVLTDILKLLHPFMPFITEEIYQALPHDEGYLMMQSWPEFREEFCFADDEARMERIMEMIRSVRESRAGLKVPNSKKSHITIVTPDVDSCSEAKDFLIRLAGASSVDIVSEELTDTKGMVSTATADAKIYMPLAELVDIENEKARIKKELEKANKEMDFVNSKLRNEKFMSKAPEKVIADIREKEAKAKALISKLEEMYNAL